MDRKTHEEVKKNFEKITELLKDGNLLVEEKQKFETLKAQLAGILFRTWLPFDWVRRSIMIVLFLVGLYGLVEGNYILLVAWLILLFFSPRFVGEFSYAIGKIFRA